MIIVGSLSTAGLLFSTPTASAAVVGDLDETLCSTILGTKVCLGIAFAEFSNPQLDYASSVALQSDGKIVAAGSSFNGTVTDFALARFKADGSLDPSFGTDGKVTTTFFAGDIAKNSRATSVAVQSDGKIVVAGSADIYNFEFNPYAVFAVARYNADGTLDPSFGTGGKVTTKISVGAFSDTASSVVLQSDGKIVVVGTSYDGFFINITVMRYNQDGTLDLDFGPEENGIVATTIDDEYSSATSVAVQSNGKIVVAGGLSTTNYGDFAVVRYNDDGTLDPSFGTGGIVTTSVTDGDDVIKSYDRASSMALQSDGAIVVAGSSSFFTVDGVENDKDFAVVRYNADGTLDLSFGTGGKVSTSISAGLDTATSVALQSDGKIVVAGDGDGLSEIAVVRYNDDGTLDTTFSGDGIATNGDFLGSLTLSGATSVALQSDGKIVVSGFTGVVTESEFYSLFLVARYIASDSTAPAPPTLTSVTGGNKQLSIVFASGGDGGAAITDYKYSLNGGPDISAGTTTSPFTIPGLSGRTAYSVTIKAINSVGLSTASSSLSATTTDSSLDANEAAAAEAARVAAAAAEAAAAEAARVAAAAAEAARVAAANAEAAQKAKEQKELTELLSVIPSIAGLALNLGDLTNSLLTTKCVKGKTVKNVKKGAKCPKGFVKKK
jgi:uncharacterized delta-60 repeat protein